MFDELFDSLIRFLSQHFELIMAVNLATLAYYAVIFILVRLSDRSVWSYLKNSLQNILFSSIFTVQVLLLVLTGYLFWAHYFKPADYLHIPGSIIENTLWVNSDTQIYFIDGHDLLSVRADGKDMKYVFEAGSPVKEYHFSPDGRFMAIVTARDLVLMERSTNKTQTIDSLAAQLSQEQLKGVISDVRWSKDSKAFAYKISRWSSVASTDSLCVYILERAERRTVDSPGRKISSAYWDESGENLYYLRYEMLDRGTVHQLKAVKIPLDTLKSEIALEIPYDSTEFPEDALDLRGIRLFMKSDILSYGGEGERQQLAAENGRRVGIDEEDNFYFINEKWFKQRLFKLRRQPKTSEEAPHRHQYQGGELEMGGIRWLPGGKYVLMEHHDLGVLILDPALNKIGSLMLKRGRNFGWHLDIDRYRILEEMSRLEPGEEDTPKKRSLSFIPE
jgi:hypothetical protein